MNLIMKDAVTAEQRTTFATPFLIDFHNMECMGCGRLSDDIAAQENVTDEDFDNYSRTTDCGHWYCHSDCFRDSH